MKYILIGIIALAGISFVWTVIELAIQECKEHARNLKESAGKKA